MFFVNLLKEIVQLALAVFLKEMILTLKIFLNNL